MYLPISLLEFNWIDFIFGVLYIFVVIESWQSGFINLISSFVSYVVSAYISFRYYKNISVIFVNTFDISTEWSDVIALIITTLVLQIVFSRIIIFLSERIILYRINNKTDKYGGFVVGLINGLMIVFVVFIACYNLPLSKQLRKDLNSSYTSSIVSEVSSLLSKYINIPVDKFNENILEFTTVDPGSKEKIFLKIKPSNWLLIPDETEEKQMLNMVNSERVKNGIMALKHDDKLMMVARAHSLDMFNNRYFSHFDASNNDVSDRLAKAGIEFLLAGENLAYAPDVKTAYEGLMKSINHKHNMLDPGFNRIGIGIIDGDIFGKIYTQVMTN